MKPPSSAPPNGLVTWAELRFMLLFVFTAGFLCGVLAHPIHAMLATILRAP